MTNVELTKLASIPYIDVPNLQGRVISSLTFYDAGEWRMWIAADDQLIVVKGWPEEAFYFAAQPESITDVYLQFFDFIAQRVSLPNLQEPIRGLRDDIFNLAASLAKISHLHAARLEIGSGVSRMVATEVEYLCSTCRSIFDLLQEIACEIWKTTALHDSSIRKRPLKETFSKMILFHGRATEQEELAERFGLPRPLTAYYMRHAEFFLALRDFRNGIVHCGSQVQTIFSGDAGFLIHRALKPFKNLDIWRDEEKLPNELVPLFPVLGIVVHKTVIACDDFGSTLEQVIEFPSPIVPGMKFFMRGYFNDILSATLRDAEDRLKGLSAERL